MQFTVDTEAKTITLIGEAGLKEIDVIKKMIGENWKEWKITSGSNIVFIDRPLPYLQPYYGGLKNPLEPPYEITFSTAGTN